MYTLEIANRKRKICVMKFVSIHTPPIKVDQNHFYSHNAMICLCRRIMLLFQLLVALLHGDDDAGGKNRNVVTHLVRGFRVAFKSLLRRDIYADDEIFQHRIINNNKTIY